MEQFDNSQFLFNGYYANYNFYLLRKHKGHEDVFRKLIRKLKTFITKNI